MKSLKTNITKFLFIILTLTLCFSNIVLGQQYTYDGEIDPIEFRLWDKRGPVFQHEKGVETMNMENHTNVHKNIPYAMIYLVNTRIFPRYMKAVSFIIAFQYYNAETKKVRYFEYNPSSKHYDEVSGFKEGTFLKRFESKIGKKEI